MKRNRKDRNIDDHKRAGLSVFNLQPSITSYKFSLNLFRRIATAKCVQIVVQYVSATVSNSV